MVAGLTFVNKGDLKDNLVSWAAEGDFDSLDLDRSIGLCEADLRRKLRILDTQKIIDLELSGETLRAPARFLAAQRLYIPGNKPMEYRSPDALIDHQLCHAGGTPSSYTLEGSEDELPIFRFSPAPDATYSVRLSYTADLGLIDDDDCNQVLAYHGDLYFYGALAHLAMFLRNEDRLPAVIDYYRAAVADLQLSDIRDKVDGSRLVPRPNQVPR